MKRYDKITILIPCHNEEKGIGRVLDDIPLKSLTRQGYTIETIVINNNSTDKTVHEAEARNVTVLHVSQKGKGNAIKAGFNAVSDDTKFVVMLDGDNTYKPKEILRLIEPLASGFSDVIIGSRLGGKIRKNSFKLQNRIANWAYTFLVRQFYRANVTDVLSGYFAWNKSVIDKLNPHLISEGFEIEMEMITKMVKFGFEIYSVPITYDKRDGQTKIQAITDGVKILSMFFKNISWSPYKENSSINVKALQKIN